MPPNPCRAPEESADSSPRESAELVLWPDILGDAISEDSERDFFSSYSTVNEPWAKWIAVTLERAGYTALLQAWDFRPGSDSIHQMHDATGP